MPQSLDAWQAQLERHFAGLSASRAVSKLPIFALEHPLQQSELQEISGLLRARLARRLPLAEHWLLWVIYATEQGYAYDVHEYWDSYESQTPYWREHADRSLLRAWFHKFRTEYNGVVPTGAWADWFTIIAWPIRHAILPRNLQMQFAEAVYGLRYKLARLDTLQPKQVGRLLANNAWNATARFREFLQQEELVGRILLALINREISAQSPIYKPTLERIVADLEKVHRAKEWLRQVRQAADQFKGVGRGYLGVGAPPSPSRPGALDEPLHRVRPGFMLRRVDRDRWSPVVDVPDFSGIAASSADLAKFLRGTRCQLTSEGIWQPAGWLLSGSQRRSLKSWPESGQPLLKFERPNGIIDNILNADFRLPSHPIWLFRVCNDGRARQVLGLTVRPSCKYVLVTRTGVGARDPMIRSTEIQCGGVIASELSVPSAISADQLATLTSLGLQVNRTVRIWPAGFVSRGWDGEGNSEWLTTETPTFAITHDHPVAAYRISIDGSAEFFIQARSQGQATFIRLPQLPPGRHHLRIAAQRRGIMDVTKELDGVVTLDVRDPLPWIAGTASHFGLAVYAEPVAASLDALSEGRVSISVHGPPGYQISAYIDLVDRTGAKTFTLDIGKFDLPLNTQSWASKLAHSVGSDQFAWKSLEATSGTLNIFNQDLGRFTQRFERDRRALQWACRNIHHKTQIRLIDDTGVETPPITSFCSFDRPTLTVPIDSAGLHSGREVLDPGGLFIATQKATTDVLLVSTPNVSGGLQGLLVNPDSGELATAPIGELLQGLHRWISARLAGPLAANRRDHVVSAVLEALYAKLCGDRWSDAERRYLANPGEPASIELLQSIFARTSSGYSAVLKRDFARIHEGGAAGTEWFASVSARYDICREPELCKSALRMASDPTGLIGLGEIALASITAELSKNVELMRGARLVAICSIAAEGNANRRLVPNWQWQS